MAAVLRYIPDSLISTDMLGPRGRAAAPRQLDAERDALVFDRSSAGTGHFEANAPLFHSRMLSVVLVPPRYLLTVTSLEQVFCSKTLHRRMVTLLRTREYRLYPVRCNLPGFRWMNPTGVVVRSEEVCLVPRVLICAA